MLVFEIIKSAGWLAGTILHAVLLLVMLEGRRERRAPGAYPWLVASALLWHFGNLLAVFAGQLMAGGLPHLDKIARLIATVGLGLLPSALVHSAVASKMESFRRPQLVIRLGYIPTVAILPAIYYQLALTGPDFMKGLRETPWVVAPLGLWFIASLVFVGRTVYALGEAAPEGITGRFNRAFGVGLFVLAFLTGVLAVLELVTGGEQVIVGEMLLMFMMMLSLLPGGLLVYYVYRYQYMDLTIRRSLSIFAVLAAVWLAHSLVIRKITDALQKRFGVNFALLEGAIVAGVVVLFEPARRRIQAAIDAAMAPERGRRRARIAAVQGEVAAAPPGDLRPVASRTQAALSEAFSAPAVVVLREPSDDLDDEADGDAGGSLACAPEEARPQAGPILEWAARAPERPSRRGELPEEAARAAEKLGLADVIPIRIDTAERDGGDGRAGKARREKKGKTDTLAREPGDAGRPGPDPSVVPPGGPRRPRPSTGSGHGRREPVERHPRERQGLFDSGTGRSGPPRAAGFIGLAPRPKGGGLGQQDADSLTVLAQTLAAAARDAHVVKRLVALEHKLAEAEKLSSLGRLSATIAHEVKNPLSSIKTIVGVLRESMSEGEPASVQTRADLDVIASEVDRLSTVVTNLLNVARPSKKPGEGTAVLPPLEGFDAREMLEGLLAVLGPDARRRGIELQTDFTSGTPRVDARESGVRQAVFQLVLNAIEVTPRGGTVTLSTLTGTYRPPHPDTDPAPGVEIVVEDTGPGIPEDRLESIFEPFVSLKPGGTGLGLAIAKDEIGRAGGQIEAGPRADGERGARFRVLLPAAKRLAPT